MADELRTKLHNIVPYVGRMGGSNMQTCLIDVLVEVPEEVSKFALERCIFSSMPPMLAGIEWHAYFSLNPALFKSKDFYMVIIAEEYAEIHRIKSGRKKIDLQEKYKGNSQYVQYLGAHELAHAYMEEKKLVELLPWGKFKTGEDAHIAVETEVDKLATKWGFTCPE